VKTQVIGEILKEMGTVSKEQIDAAVHVQRVTNEVLGEILVKLNFVTTEELARAVALQHGLEYIDLDGYVPAREILELVDKEFALFNMVIPLKLEKGSLVVVTARPEDEEIRAYLQESTGYPILFAVSDNVALGKYLRFYYEQLDRSIEEQINDIIKASVEEEIDAIDFVDRIISGAIKDRATDIHIMSERLTSHIFYRIDGVLKHTYSIPLSLRDSVVTRVKVLSGLDIAQHMQPQNGEFQIEFYRSSYNIRVSCIPTLNGEKLALRLMPESFRLYTLENLGFEPDLIEQIGHDLQRRSGIVLVIGSSGSGKTTTLYAMLRKIDILRRNVISVEEPVEYRLPFVNQIQTSTRADYSFGKALHYIARQDPDVIAVGEILDEETAKLTIRSSITGHLILSTLSGGSAVTAIARLKNLGINAHFLSDGLLSVLSQKLLRRLCSECKKEVEISKKEMTGYFGESCEEVVSLQDEKVTIYEADGCEHCRGSGYMGRIAVAEYFRVDDTIREMIEHGKSSTEIQRYILSIGGTTIKTDALKKLLEGTTSLREIMRVIG
jgi:type II secretory ATPase GspE/PulE/Tfp pilus assembly ATPase PilB-like protein